MTQKRIIGAVQRRAEIVVVTLFLVTAAASIPAAIVGDLILNTPNYLAEIFPKTLAIAAVSLLWSINNIGIVFIAVFEIILLPFWLFFRGFKLPKAIEIGVSE